MKATWQVIQKNSRGVAVLFNNDFEFKVNNIDRDENGNWIVLNICMLSMNITLVSLYGPNDDQPNFYTHVKNVVNNFGNPHCILCGDFNLVQDQNLDTFNYLNRNNPKAKEIVLKIKEDMDLCDPWRILNPNNKRFTWRKSNPIKQARLDFFLVSSEILNVIDYVDILPGYRTDHSMVIIGLCNSNIQRGRGAWKLNNDLLEDEEYVKAVKDAIINVKQLYAATPYNTDNIGNIDPANLELMISDQLFFEVLLLEIRGVSIAYASKRKKEMIKNEEILYQRITELEKLYEEAVSKDDSNAGLLSDDLNVIKLELEELRKKKN